MQHCRNPSHDGSHLVAGVFHQKLKVTRRKEELTQLVRLWEPVWSWCLTPINGHNTKPQRDL